jgi:hypothetical protein
VLAALDGGVTGEVDAHRQVVRAVGGRVAVASADGGPEAARRPAAAAALGAGGSLAARVLR